MVHFEAENNSFPAASKLARRAGPETARAPTATHDGIRAQALVQHHTGNFFFPWCLICGTPHVNGLNRHKTCKTIWPLKIR